ncbi:NCS1 nucleoside transporter [Colletotrichum scovillei]|uniref:NCS1 nucleoside transporter n=1 Tax=Colletotrichum scovillei TaxID=1209932 RepID=A0A9P7RA14_9PEZI|nr:NCS1 nucleoside transporter [Colletotrichum scovillei]
MTSPLSQSRRLTRRVETLKWTSTSTKIPSLGVCGVMGGLRIFQYWRLDDGFFLDLLGPERLEATIRKLMGLKQSMIAIVVAHTFVGFVEATLAQSGISGFRFGRSRIRVYGVICFPWVLLTCVWPSHLDLDSELANGTMKVYDLISFILYFLLCLPSHRKPSQAVTFRLDHGGDSRFMLSIWGTARAGGGGAILADVSKVSGIKPAQGGDLGWAVVAMVTAILEVSLSICGLSPTTPALHGNQGTKSSLS